MLFVMAYRSVANVGADFILIIVLANTIASVKYRYYLIGI